MGFFCELEARILSSGVVWVGDSFECWVQKGKLDCEARGKGSLAVQVSLHNHTHGQILEVFFLKSMETCMGIFLSGSLA